MNWEAASAERIGGRNEQQDRVGCFHSPDGTACLLLLADGMGGHRGASLASQTLLETARISWDSCGGAPRDPKRFLEALCQESHRRINLQGRERGLDPRSTVVALIAHDAGAFWVHVGDSRLYHFRGQELVARTRDHSLVQILVEAGQVAEEDMATHPDQNKLLRSVGDEAPPETTHGHAAFRAEDRFLLCSDGFWEQIAPEEMAGVLAARNLDESLSHLADLAVRRGGPSSDNIAVAAVRALVERGGSVSGRQRLSGLS
ncbi:MAG: protein phosphatase 2C domain-containing protein [Marinobacter sp.]